MLLYFLQLFHSLPLLHNGTRLKLNCEDTVGNKSEFSQKFNAIITAINNTNQRPTNYSLLQNYPNPFNPSTNIIYSIPHSIKNNDNSSVKLKIFNCIGKEIATLVNRKATPGKFNVNFNAANLSNGVYYYQLNVISNSNKIDYSETKKMIFLK